MYLDPNHFQTNQLMSMLIDNAQIKSELDLIESLKPIFSMDGNQYCYLYGTLPNDCIVGYGETAAKAMSDFCNNFYTQKA